MIFQYSVKFEIFQAYFHNVTFRIAIIIPEAYDFHTHPNEVFYICIFYWEHSPLAAYVTKSQVKR